MTYETFVRDHRRRLGYSVREFATRAGLPKTTIARHEADANWRWPELAQIAVQIPIPLELLVDPRLFSPLLREAMTLLTRVDRTLATDRQAPTRPRAGEVPV